MKKSLFTRFLNSSRLSLAIFLGFAAIASSSFAENQSELAGSEAKELHSKLAYISTLSASFQQTIRDHEGFSVQETEGEFKLRRPSSVYWETLPPYEQLVIANQESLWIYDPDLEQVTVQDSDGALDGPLALLSETADAIQAKYSVERVELENKVTFVLQPQGQDSQIAFERVQFVFSQDNVLTKMVIRDKLKQETIITFTDQVINASIPDAVFAFVIPEGVDVVRDD